MTIAVNQTCPHCIAGLPSRTTEGIVWHHTAIDAPYTCIDDAYTVEAIERGKAIIDGRIKPITRNTRSTVNTVQDTEKGLVSL